MKRLRTYHDLNRAQTDQALLQSEGVLTYLKNENLMVLNPVYGQMSGAIELEVDDADYDRALEILGPEEVNIEVVEQISRRFNRIFGLSLAFTVLAGILHYCTHFDPARADDSITIALISGFIIFFAGTILTRDREN